MGNAILFPAPLPTYGYRSESVEKHLVWIPEGTSLEKAGHSNQRFPALFFPAASPHVLLYFHGNSADLGDISDELGILHRYLRCNILGIEFPGYGICGKSGTLPSVIDSWGRSAVNWLLKRGAHPLSIIPFGRSIGTGPAAKLAASLKAEALQVGGLILHSPFMSIHKIVAEYFMFGTWLIGDHWNTETALKSLAPDTPLLVVHGENDEVIPVHHGKQLLEGYAVDSDLKMATFPIDCPHNAYLIIDHLGVPIKRFLQTMALSRHLHPQHIVLSREDCRVPIAYEALSTASSVPMERKTSMPIFNDQPTTEAPPSVDPPENSFQSQSDSAPSVVSRRTSKKGSGRSFFCSCFPEKSEVHDVFISN